MQRAGPTVLDNVGALPEGGPASPLGLTCVIAEALRRVKAQRGAQHAAFIDDRTWFARCADETVAIAQTWKREMNRINMSEIDLSLLLRRLGLFAARKFSQLPLMPLTCKDL